MLVGQPELADRLNDPSLRQLKQRIVLRCLLAPLDLVSTASYIAARLGVAGASPGDVFTKDAVLAIYEASRGIPRTIGVICENALLAGYAAQTKPIGSAVVTDVCRDLDLAITDWSPGEDAPQPEYGVAAHARPTPAAHPRPVRCRRAGTPGGRLSRTPRFRRAGAPGGASHARPASAAQAHRVFADADDQAAPEPDAPAPAESMLPRRRAARRFWLPARSHEPQPAADPETAAADDRPRMFRFF